MFTNPLFHFSDFTKVNVTTSCGFNGNYSVLVNDADGQMVDCSGCLSDQHSSANQQQIHVTNLYCGNESLSDMSKYHGANRDVQTGATCNKIHGLVTCIEPSTHTVNSN